MQRIPAPHSNKSAMEWRRTDVYFQMARRRDLVRRVLFRLVFILCSC